MEEEQIKLAIGSVLRRIRKSKKLSQQEFCNRIDSDRSFYSEVENGKYMPNLSLVFKFAEVFEVSVTEIMSEVESVLEVEL